MLIPKNYDNRIKTEALGKETFFQAVNLDVLIFNF